jgi:hypothetical protein
MRRGPRARWSIRRAAAILSEEQFERLRTELDENYRGAKNAGRPLLLEGGLDWKSLSLIAEGHGFHRGETFERARNRARLRRAADAAGHSRRQHLLELRRSQPRALSPDRAALWPGACSTP